MLRTHHLTDMQAASPKAASATPRFERVAAIDHFRGFAVLMMAIMNHLLGVESLPVWLRHTPDIGLTVTDLGAPWFIFAIALTYRRSFERRVGASGVTHTRVHFIKRAASLFMLGFVMAYAEQRLRQTTAAMCWSPLQAIGTAVLLTLPVITLPVQWRLAVGIALLTGYQLLLDAYWLPLVLGSTHGGPPGALGWTAMLILATVFADLSYVPSRRKLYALATAVACAGGLALSLWVPVSKSRISASYVLVGLGLSAALYALFYILNDRLGWRSDSLTAWGKNSLALYLLLNVLLAFLVLPDIPVWHTQAPFWLAAAQALVLVAILGRIAHWLERRGLLICL
jgi:predicted acyltransferase